MKLLKLLLCCFLIFTGCSPKQETNQSATVVVYVSEDQVFSEPILKDFERETGIKIKAVYDTEETKGTGVMNRLLAEKDNPQCDVYWANEPIRAEVLKQNKIAVPYESPAAKSISPKFRDPQNNWTGFSSRARVFIVNKSAQSKPESILDYLDPKWKGKAVIANPLFGTTTVQMAALFSIWGDEKAKNFLNGLKTNQVKISSGNGESADLVASGEFDFALVDTDDAISRIKQGKAVDMIFPDQKSEQTGMLFLPNVVVLIKGGPNTENGKKLMDYLLSPETERKLAFADCAQIPLQPGVDTPPIVPRIEKIRTMNVSYSDLALKLQEIQPHIKEWVGY
jgi:iron(III) transport system substrate-binding protein